MSLSDAQVERYSRQIILPEVGGRGQALLLRSSLWLAGSAEPLAGAARYLAAAGVGRFVVAGGDPALSAELAALQPEARVESKGMAASADVALAGATASALTDGPFWIRGGVAGSRAWVARGVRATLFCRNCADTAPTADAIFEPVALGLAAAQMALAAVTHLLGIDAENAPSVTVFDVASGRWADAPGIACVVCGGEHG